MVPSGDTAHTPVCSGSWYTRTSTRSPGPRVRRVSESSVGEGEFSADASAGRADGGVRHAVSAASSNTTGGRIRISEARSIRYGHPNIPFVPGVVEACHGLCGRPDTHQVANASEEPPLERVLGTELELVQGVAPGALEAHVV